MKLLKYFSSLLILMFVVLSIGNAQLIRTTTKVGTTVAPFLKIGAGARAVAMGGSAVAMEGDVYSVYWNAGSLARLKTNGESSFNHTQWLADMNYDYAASALTLEGVGTLGLSLTSFSVPEDLVRTDINPDGDGRRWSAGSFALGVSFARSLTDRFSIGFTAKYISEYIWNMSSNGVAFDIGTIYTTEFNGLRIGASISNFGTKLRLEGHDISFNSIPGGRQGQEAQNVESQYKTDAFDIPLMFRIGVAMDAIQMDKIRATIAVDATHPNDNVEYVNTGVEFAFDEMLFARAGYKSLFYTDSEEGITWGFGVNIGISNLTAVKVDYAFADFGRLKNVQYITVSVTY